MSQTYLIRFAAPVCETYERSFPGYLDDLHRFPCDTNHAKTPMLHFIYVFAPRRARRIVDNHFKS